jgi:hypothetical protein
LLCRLSEADFDRGRGLDGGRGLDEETELRRRRKAACLEKNEYLKIIRALQRLVRLARG